MDFNPCPTPTTTSRSKLREGPLFWSFIGACCLPWPRPSKRSVKRTELQILKRGAPLTKRNSFKRNFTMLVTSLLICKEGILSNEESIATTTTIYSSSFRYPRSITRRNTNVHLIGIVEAIYLFPYFI